MTAIGAETRKRWTLKDAASAAFAATAVGLGVWAVWDFWAGMPSLFFLALASAAFLDTIVRSVADAWTRSGLPKSPPRSPLEIIAAPNKPEPQIVYPRLDPILGIATMALYRVGPAWALGQLFGRQDWLRAAALLPYTLFFAIGMVRQTRLLIGALRRPARA